MDSISGIEFLDEVFTMGVNCVGGDVERSAYFLCCQALADLVEDVSFAVSDTPWLSFSHRTSTLLEK